MSSVTIAKEFLEKVEKQCADCVRSSHGAHCAWIFSKCPNGEYYEKSEPSLATRPVCFFGRETCPYPKHCHYKNECQNENVRAKELK